MWDCAMIRARCGENITSSSIMGADTCGRCEASSMRTRSVTGFCCVQTDGHRAAGKDDFSPSPIRAPCTIAMETTRRE